MSSMSFSDSISTKSNVKLAFVLAMGLLLSACGAGGGSEDAATNNVDSQTNNETEQPITTEPEQVAPVVISTHPENLTLSAGESATFSVAASGGGSLIFQWRKDQQEIVNATGSTLSISNISDTDAALYDVIVSNSEGSETSLSALLTVNTPVVVIEEPSIDPVTIVSQPQSISVNENESASFSVSATGGGDISYQWLKNGLVITGAQSTALNLSSVSLSDSATYSVRVTNSEGVVTSNSASLTVNEVLESVAIVSQPTSTSVQESSSASFSVLVTGDGDISYQWMKDGEEISGENDASLNFSSVTLDDAADYQVVVTNSVGSVLSSLAELNVTALPEAVAIINQPQTLSVDESSDAVFTVEASGDGDISYQWLKDGEVIDGAAASSLTLSSASLTDAGAYSVIVSNSQGPVISESANLTVNIVEVIASIELSWDIPEQREDGSSLPLYEIDGYVIAYGSNQNELTNQLVVEGASTTTTLLENLNSGTYYFSIATVDSDGVQGAYSSVIQQSI